MARQRADTRAEIRAAALDFFVEKGFEQTSLREIAERLGITKAALYYHFPSKVELLREVVQPLLDDVAVMLDTAERAGEVERRRILEGYYDTVARHRRVFMAMLSDASALTRLDVIPLIFSWRGRLQALLFGPDADPEETARATVAIGGLQDAAVILTDSPSAAARTAAVDAALRALTP